MKLSTPADPPEPHSVIADLIDAIREALLHARVERADELAAAIAAAVQHRFRGSLMYIPIGKRHQIRARNAAIAREFDGKNHHVLARRYGVTVATVYAIVKRPVAARSGP